MKVGALCRVDNRGIGVQSMEFARCLPADKVLAVIAGVDKTNNRPISPYAQHPERFDKGWVRTVTWNPPDPLPEEILREFLDGLNTFYCIETPYDNHIFHLARQMGVVSVLHANPEFYRYGVDTQTPKPDVVWLPTSWLADQIPGATIVPFPVNRSHIPYRPRPAVPSFLHIVGHRTRGDRNGTLVLLRALRYIRQPVSILIRSQDPIPNVSVPRHITLNVQVADIDNYADLYVEGNVLVLPRKFGGLSLPLNESLAAGLGVLMNNCPPQNTFLPPEMLIPARKFNRPLRSQLGPITLYESHPRDLAQRIDHLAEHPNEIERMSKMADELAETISWDTLRPGYFQEFEKAIDRVKK